MGIFDFTKRLFYKTHNFREYLEDKLADLLEKIDKSQKVDELETQIIQKGIEYGIEYCTKADVIPKDFTQGISEEIVKCLGKLNKMMVKQLRKK